MIKKLVTHDNFEFCATYDTKRAVAVIGGKRSIHEKIYKIYLSIFDECDGPLEFFQVTTNCLRLKFTMSNSKWADCMKKLKRRGFDIYDIDSLERRM